jgi:hypothetical protein
VEPRHIPQQHIRGIIGIQNSNHHGHPTRRCTHPIPTHIGDINDRSRVQTHTKNLRKQKKTKTSPHT